MTTTTPGPIYDNGLRLLARRSSERLCDWLALPVQGQPVLHQSEALPGRTQHLDLLTRIAPGRLAHVEFERSPSPGMAERMLEYRARIMRLHPGHRVTQHVVVLAQGTVPPHLADPPELSFELNVTYLRDQDPEPLLTDPDLAPLAVLARARDVDERADHLRRALRLIATVTDHGERHDLLHIAAVLAGIHFGTTVINELTQEAGMPFTLDENTVAGREIAAIAEARGRAAGKAEGKAEGEGNERVAILASLMRHTFGDDPRIDALSERMAALPRDAAVSAAMRATTLDDLDRLTRPDAAPDRPGPADQ